MSAPDPWPDFWTPDFWTLEEKFWLQGEGFQDGHLHGRAVMAFPPPANILAGKAIRDSLKGAPRWTTVAMLDRVTSRPAQNVALLAYRCTARRGDEPPYEANCTSTYVQDGGAWKIVQHQQTPRTKR